MIARARRSLVAIAVAVSAAAAAGRPLAQAPEPARGVRYARIDENDLKKWLTYLASDALQGRQIHTEGYGLAAAYVAKHLGQWGVKPLGENGTYFVPVLARGYKTTRNSSVTITVGGASTTFKHGDHVAFPANVGGPQTVTFTGVEFVGYGRPVDYQERDVRNKLVVWIPRGRDAPAVATGRGGGGTPAAITTLGAKGVVSFSPAAAPPGAAEEALAQAQAALDQAREAVARARAELQGRGTGPGGGRGTAPAPDFTTGQRIDNLVPPQFTADQTVFDLLFSQAPTRFAALKAAADKGEQLKPASLDHVTVAVTLDHTYELVSSQVSRNVVGMVEGNDPALRDTFVLFTAHLDHVGYRPAGGARGSALGNCRRTQDSVPQKTPESGGGEGSAPPPAAVPLDQQDVISNGADDDGSGSAGLMAIARAFATGPKPRRSVAFFWFGGEESGLLGSRYDADHPVVALDKVQTVLNMDMIGRDDCDNARGDYSNSVFVVGADRISTDLHNLIVGVNARESRPLSLDYELNDVNDPEAVYTRSDHYSYAAKGIPVAFFTTGLHRDYHQVSDTVDKIRFPKLARIAQLVYEIGFSVAATERALERDNKGPRSGKGFSGRIDKSR